MLHLSRTAFKANVTPTNLARTFAARADPSDYPGNDLASFFRSFLDVRSSVLNGGDSWAHNLYTSFALEVVKSRIGKEYTLPELLEGTPLVLHHVTELINAYEYQELADLCVRGPGRDAVSIERAVASYGLLPAKVGGTGTGTGTEQQVLTCEITGPAVLEALQFDFEGWENKSLHPPLNTTIINELTRVATDNVRGLSQEFGLVGLGEHMMESDLCVMAAIHIPATICMLSKQRPSTDDIHDGEQAVPPEEGEEGEEEAVLVDQTEDECFTHESEGCRLILQSDVMDDNTLHWKLIHVDMGVLRFQDVEPPQL